MKKFLLVLVVLLAFQINVSAKEQFPFDKHDLDVDIENDSDLKIDNDMFKDKELSVGNFDKKEVVKYKSYGIQSVDKKEKDVFGLDIYTPMFGETTKTDKKGFEAVIVNNKVVKLNQYNSYIPRNGYVVSGHGLAKKFITKNLFEGADVEIDFAKDEFRVITHPDNYIIEATYKLDNAKNVMEKTKTDSFERENMEFYISKSEEILNRTKKVVQFQDYEKSIEMAKDSMVYSDRALYYSLPYKKDEFKAVWVTPTQKSKEEVAKDFDAVQHTYVNNIFIEVFKNGSTIYKSDVAKEYGLKEQNEDYANFDVLNEWIRLAQLNDINVYLSFNTFNLGKPKQSTIKTNIVKVHPDWLIDKDVPKGEEYFINPENQQAQAFLFDLLREASEKYNIAGININGLNIEGYNAGVTNFVNKLVERKFIKNLSINVYSEDMSIKNWKLDDDITIMPVLTSPDTDYARDFLTSVKYYSQVKNIYPVYTQSYQEELPRSFFEQVAIARELGMNGIVIYDLDCMTKEFFTAIRFCIFREPSTKKQFSLYERK
ncbi:MAG: family 10 glycosylhydrolase [Candidatus Gastranaerophilales bacterium]|nr:family 10 glycosylhydrolase [Candidatus Gastranaerophilales bacterium]